MKHIDSTELVRLYNLNLSFKDIGKKLGVCQDTIGRRLRSLGFNTNIKRNNQTAEKNPRWKGGYSRSTIKRATKQLLLDEEIPLNICQECKKTFSYNLPRHHNDEVRLNNDITNIRVLCHSCHAKNHGLGRYIR